MTIGPMTGRASASDVNRFCEITFAWRRAGVVAGWLVLFSECGLHPLGGKPSRLAFEYGSSVGSQGVFGRYHLGKSETHLFNVLRLQRSARVPVGLCRSVWAQCRHGTCYTLTRMGLMSGHGRALR